MFLVFLLLTWNKQNPAWVVTVTVPKNRDVVVCKKHLIFQSEANPEPVIHLCKKSLKILTRSSILRSTAECWIYLGCFFRFTISVGRPFFLLTFLKINWRRTLHTIVCSRYKLETLHWVWDLPKFDNRDTITMFHLTLGRFLNYFLVLLLLTLNILCLLWMS